MRNKPSSKVEKTTESFLEKVDFSLLRKSIQDILDELNIDYNEVDLGFVEKQNIQSVSNLKKILHINIVGRMRSNDNEASVRNRQSIELNDLHVKLAEFFINDRSDSPTINFDSLLMMVLCHEEIHAISKNKTSDWQKKNYMLNERKRSGGFARVNEEQHRLFKKSKIREVFFASLDEAVTDMLGEELYNRYITEQNSIVKFPYLRAYKRSRSLVDIFLDKVSKECQIERTEVLKMLFKAKILGGDLEGQRVQQLFRGLLPKNFFNRAKKVSEKNYIKIALLKRTIKTGNWSKEDVTRLRRWIKLFLSKQKTMDDPLDKR